MADQPDEAKSAVARCSEGKSLLQADKDGLMTELQNNKPRYATQPPCRQHHPHTPRAVSIVHTPHFATNFTHGFLKIGFEVFQVE